jgi:hypothetical protein
MTRAIACLLIIIGLSADAAHAQFGVPWRHTPNVTVIGPAGDPRSKLVDEAISFWNKVLEEIGSGFRLSGATRIVQPVPEQALHALSRSIVGGPRGTIDIPQALRDLPGDLTARPSSCRLPVRSTPMRNGWREFAECTRRR